MVLYNISQSDTFIPPLPTIASTHGQLALNILYLLTSLVILVSNLIVIVVEVNGTESAQNIRRHLISLAVSDIISGVLCTPFTYIQIMQANWTFPKWLCPASQFSTLLSASVTSLTLTLIGLERYMATVHPHSDLFDWFKSHTNILISLIWILSGTYSAIISTKTHIFTFTHKIYTTSVCATNESYLLVTFQFVLTFVLPFVVLICAYSAIIRYLKQNQKDPILSKDHYQYSKIIKMLFVIILLYGICWLPIKSFNLLFSSLFNFLLRHFNRETLNVVILRIWFVSHWLSMANGFVNPIVYSFMSVAFRKDFKKVVQILTKCSFKKQDLRLEINGPFVWVDYSAYESYTESTDFIFENEQQSENENEQQSENENELQSENENELQSENENEQQSENENENTDDFEVSNENSIIHDFEIASENNYEQKIDNEIDNDENTSKFWKNIFLVLFEVFLVLFCVIILFGLKLMDPSTNDSHCKIPNVIQNFTIASNESLNKTFELNENKRQFVKRMMNNSWNSYVKYAWGHEALRPISKTVYDDGSYEYSLNIGNNSGLSIIASMSTLWTMGLKEEFAKGKKWIEEKLDLRKIDKSVRVSDLLVNYVGGLMSCYALTKDDLFLNKTKEIVQLVEPAFNTQTGTPYQQINLKTSKLTFETSSLSQVCEFDIDFSYLSYESGETKLRKQIRKVRNIFKETENPENLFTMLVDVNGKWPFRSGSSEGLTRELYTFLVKSFIQSNLSDVGSIEIYKKAFDALEAVKMFGVSSVGFHYVRNFHDINYNMNKDKETMHYSDCYLGSMLSMGANAMQRALALNSSLDVCRKQTEQNRINRHWKLAEEITRTCQQASDRTKTGLGSNRSYFNDTRDVDLFGYYHLSPELAESNFILWRLTHNEKYRDNAWKMAQAIHKHCRAESGGYAGIEDVNELPSRHNDYQPSIFLSATLKYLYLTFTEDSHFSLDKWVFNSVGHLLPVCVNSTKNALCKLE